MFRTLRKSINFVPRYAAAFMAVVAIALASSCSQSDDKNDKRNMNLLTLAALSGDYRSHEAMVLVPQVLAVSADPTTSSGASHAYTVGSDMNASAIPQGSAANNLKNIYLPVRQSIKIGKDLVTLGGRMVASIEQVVASRPQLLGNVMATTDSSDTAHPGRIVRLSASSTFGAGGRKAEVWWTNTGSDPLRDGKKFIELDYTIDAATRNFDGVLFFRGVPTAQSTTLASARLDFKKVTVSGLTTRTAYIHVQNWLDLRAQSGGAAFFITEDGLGNVNVEGVYTLTGQPMPFFDNNTKDAVNWGPSTQRLYMFNGAGSDALGKAVVQVVLPKQLVELANAQAAPDPFANAQAWSLGTLFTSAFLNKVSDDGNLPYLNTISSSSLTTGSTQAQLQTALGRITTTDPAAQAHVQNMQVVTGIMNPVYFARGFFSNTLIGQQDTTGLAAIVGDVGVAQYIQLQTMLPSANVRTTGNLFTMDLKLDAWIQVISGHPGSVKNWTGRDDTIPAITLN